MTDTQTIEAIQKHLDEHPTDWIARRELADLYDDDGRTDEARLQRWLVQWQKAPMLDYRRSIRPVWQWYGYDGPSSNRSAWLGWLAYCVTGYGYGYRTRAEAERFLLCALINHNWTRPV